jgi:hypothetical protein
MPRASRVDQLTDSSAKLSTRILRSGTRTALQKTRAPVYARPQEREVTAEWLVHYLTREKAQGELSETEEEAQKRKKLFDILEEILTVPVHTVFVKAYTRVTSTTKVEVDTEDFGA